MRPTMIRGFLGSCLIAAACMVGGCAPGSELESSDPGLDALIGDPDGKADGTDVLADFYDGRVRTSSAGKVLVELGKRYGDTLAFDLPAAGVRLVEGWIDGTPYIGVPEGSFTELALYRIHKPAELLGHLYIDTDGQDLAIELIRRRKGGTTQVSAYINRSYPTDIGRPDVEVDYVVLVGPGPKKAKGEGSQTFRDLRFTIHEN